MYCTKCGNKNIDGAEYCASCGFDLSKQTSPERKVGGDTLDASATEIAPDIPEQAFAIGTLYANRYEILNEGKAGGMGAVYKCKDTKLNKVFALKIIHPRLLKSKTALSRFRQEVAISQELTHPNIVKVFNLEEYEGKEYFSMEWIEGVTLRDVIEERKKESRPFSLKEANVIIGQLTGALQYAHKYTVHRDIKPENILIEGLEIHEAEVSEKINIKLTDFGIAKMLSPSEFTSTSVQMGTPYYMAPEQKVDAGSVDGRADVYACGVLLFELLTLENTIGLKLPSEINKSLPEEIDLIIKKALDTDREQRYAAAHELRDDLAECKAVEVKEEVVPQSRAVKEQSDPEVKSKGWMWVAAVVLLAVVGVGVYMQGIEKEGVVKLPEAETAEVLVKSPDSVPVIKKNPEVVEVIAKPEKQESEPVVPEKKTVHVEKKIERKGGKGKSGISEEARLRIASLLVKADEQIGSSKYTAPSGDNAHATLKEVLYIAPGHSVAEKKLREIAEAYVKRGDTAYEGKEYKKAEEEYGKADTVVTGYKGAEAGMKQVKRVKAEEKKAEEQRKIAAEKEAEHKRENEARIKAEIAERERQKKEAAILAEKLNIKDPYAGELVFVKGGCYQMGDQFGDGESDEKPVHEVCVDDYYIGKYEVTQGQWKGIMGNNPSKFTNCGDNCPVEQVSWDDVQTYIKKLNQKTGKSYRLPTEAEWEYAARSGGKKEKYAGFSSESELSKYVNYCDKNCEFDWKDKSHDDGYKYISPVGKYRPNGLGIYDMSGNVYEWVNDWYHEKYYEHSGKHNPKGPGSDWTGLKYRVLRGGSWLNDPRIVRSSNRSRNTPDTRGNRIGFRVALPPQD